MNPLRPKFDKDLEDYLVFLKEVLIVTWRLNPAGIAAYTCGELFQAVTETTPNEERARMVEEVLSSIEIAPVELFEKNFTIGIADICKNSASEVIKDVIKEYPQIAGLLVNKFSQEEAQMADSFSKLTLSAIKKQRQHYERLEEHFTQLTEFVPRYVAILNRGDGFDGILGFAAGLFGGYLGAAGAEVWCNWRNSNDSDFCQKFGSAFEQFAQSCSAYTIEGENALSLVFDRLIDEDRRLHHKIFDCYEELEKHGCKMERLYALYCYPVKSLDQPTRQLFEIALSNLEENRSVHYRTIENIRLKMGLSA